MQKLHRKAAITIAVSIPLDIGLGIAFGAADHIGPWNGMYFATTIGTTTGNSPYFPHGWFAYLLAILMHITILPLAAATISLFTAGVTAGATSWHVRSSEARVKAHVEAVLRHHLGKENIMGEPAPETPDVPEDPAAEQAEAAEQPVPGEGETPGGF